MANYTSFTGNTIIDLHSINAINIEDNAGTFTGNNNQFGWANHSKTNSVNTIRGSYNTTYSRFNVVDDRDLCDTFINDPDINTNYGSLYR